MLRAALVLKGLDGLVELLAGLALLVVGPRTLDAVTRRIVEHHLLGNPHGALADRFTAGEAALGSGDRTFAVVYLVLHGLVKLGLVVALLREVLRAYPVAIGVVGLFCAYEAYRAVQRGSWSLGVAAALDLAVIVLVVLEYRRLRSRRRPAGGAAPPRGG
ncbi:MAG TPA: DUF2127 domain-containing protein [Geodermatophilus sp.]|nr:DUF2127 domain-containing protein [Geodermatophilus sp.]